MEEIMNIQQLYVNSNFISDFDYRLKQAAIKLMISPNKKHTTQAESDFHLVNKHKIEITE